MEQNQAQKQTHAFMVNWFMAKLPRTHNGEKTSLQKMVPGKLVIHMQKNGIGPLSYIKINSECINA
jgi:hypothetical protein